jgi:hypothetical protein
VTTVLQRTSRRAHMLRKTRRTIVRAAAAHPGVAAISAPEEHRAELIRSPDYAQRILDTATWTHLRKSYVALHERKDQVRRWRAATRAIGTEQA